MGRVYRALDPSLGRRVALKVLIADGKNETARGEAAARMMREARAAAAFMHPNVVAIYDVGQVEGAPFIAMELVTGTTLRACVGNAEISGTQKLAWLIDVARGLGAAHRAGLVHRDMKPENVMITADGVVKVLDFGIARRTEASAVEGSTPTQPAHLASVTADGLAVGTPQYMAPEQLHASPLDGRCDQYAWGVMAYEMFSGQLPWGAKDGAQLVAAVLAAPVKPLRDVVRSNRPAPQPRHCARHRSESRRQILVDDRARRSAQLDGLAPSASGDNHHPGGRSPRLVSRDDRAREDPTGASPRERPSRPDSASGVCEEDGANRLPARRRRPGRRLVDCIGRWHAGRWRDRRAQGRETAHARRRIAHRVRAHHGSREPVPCARESRWGARAQSFFARRA